MINQSILLHYSKIPMFYLAFLIVLVVFIGVPVSIVWSLTTWIFG